MRKTKLIILPTKCLNQVGFLLLFLSCPVIGDWGRIRPDSEMSQWSILIEREGSCGLVRDSPGIEKSKIPDGLTECYSADVEFRNNTQPMTGIMEKSDEPQTDILNHPEFPIRKSRIEKRNIRSNRMETRVSNARRESQERSFRRSVQSRTDRRANSLDRQAAFRHDERRSERVQREMREKRDYRRMTRSLDRGISERRASQGRRIREINDAERRLSVSRQERESNKRWINFETARRRIENARDQSRSDRRVDERRLTRQALSDERNDARRDAETRNIARREVRQNSVEQRMERREQRVNTRTAFDQRMNREVTERRSDDRTGERRIRALNAQEREIQAERRMRDTAEIRRGGEKVERNARFIRSELGRRIEGDISRVRVRRVDKPKDFRFEYRIKEDKLEPLMMEKSGQFLGELKTWFGQKNNHEDWMSNHGDFALTCLVGAAVYLLTTRQVKSM